MNDLPLVSVIMPIYNSVKYLKDSLESIINQTYKNFEIIIVDDSPKDDGSLAIIRSFNDKRIRYIKPKERMGLVKSMNYAIKLSNGEFCARMDADDISHIKRFEMQVKYLQENEDVSVVGSNCFIINEHNKIIGAYEYPSDDNDIKLKMLFNSPIVHPSVMIRKKLLLENLYNENCFCCEDYELWSRLIYKTKFHNIKEKLIKYRIIKESAMHFQLSKLKKDEEYYIRHLSILRNIYQNILSYLFIDASKLGNDFAELILAKKLDNYTFNQKELFIENYSTQIYKTNLSHERTWYFIAYNWIKMTKFKFILCKNIKLKINCLKVIFDFIYLKLKSIIEGLLFNNIKLFDWKI